MTIEVDQDRYFSTSAAVRRDHLAVVTPYEPPVGAAEAAIAAIWALALDFDRVGRHDDFFDLGGDSYAATEIAAGIEDHFGKAFPPARVVDTSTVASQAAWLVGLSAKAASPEASSCLVGYQVSGTRPPLFLIHGAYGFTFFNKTFLEFFGSEQPVYLFHVPGFNGEASGFETLEELAAIYVAAMQAIQPKGPYNIASICTGAFLGLEMCIRLQKQREQVKNLILIDPSPVPKKIAYRYPAISKRNVQWFGMMQANIRRFFVKFGNSVSMPWEKIHPGKGGGDKKLHKRFQKKVEKLRLAGELSDQELLFKTDDMVKALIALKTAYRNYEPKNSYAGHAHFLVNNIYGQSTIRDDLFWKNHLSSLDYEVGPGTHDDFFNKHILLVADFVKRLIDK